MTQNIERTCYKSGKIYCEKYYDQDGHLHRDDGPAEIWYYPNGNIKRELYYLNNRRHRDDGPAYIIYYQDGSINDEYYFQNGKQHRDDGPAIIQYYENSDTKYEWWLNGINYSFDEWLTETPLSNEDKLLFRLKYM